MNLINLLQQLKKIEPERGYAERSRRMLLAAPPHGGRRPLTLRRALIETLQFSVAVAAIWIFFLLAAGGFPFGPFRGIDTNHLKAEADAIDLQIELVNLNYFEVVRHQTTTARTALPAEGGRSAFPVISPASSSQAYIEDALEALSEE